MIGAMTTFAHDFFITPSDSKPFFTVKFNEILMCSDQTETLIVLSFDRRPMCEEYNQR